MYYVFEKINPTSHFEKPHTTPHPTFFPHLCGTYHINVVLTCGEIPHHMWYCLSSTVNYGNKNAIKFTRTNTSVVETANRTASKRGQQEQLQSQWRIDRRRQHSRRKRFEARAFAYGKELS